MSRTMAVPPNASAVVYVPAVRAEDVNEGDRPAVKAKGVTFLHIQRPADSSVAYPRAVFEIVSGRYRFRATLPPHLPSQERP